MKTEIQQRRFEEAGKTKAVMKSVAPQQFVKIVNHGCRAIVSKQKPGLKPPFKCYMYCKNDRIVVDFLCMIKKGYKYDRFNDLTLPKAYFGKGNDDTLPTANGKVVGGFTCDRIDEYDCCFDVAKENVSENSNLDKLCRDGHMSMDEVKKFAGTGRQKVYCLHIKNLILFENRELSAFTSWCENRPARCKGCAFFVENGYCKHAPQLSAPPKGWCYVEELPNDNL